MTANATTVSNSGITLSKTTASVNESGTTDTFTVVLDAQPSSNVVIDLSSDTTAEATVSPNSLTFTNSNWDTAQTVTITGVDDSSIDGSQNATVSIAVNDASSDDNYDPLSNQTVSVTVVDNDYTPDATLTAGSTVTEPVNLPTTADTSGEAVNLFDFKITDGGGGDGLSTDVTQIVLHTSGTADFSKVTWRLNGNDATNVVGTYNSVAKTLTFSGLSISVADGANETYTISGYYHTPTGLINKQSYGLSLDGDDDLTVSGTQMSGSNSAVDNGTGTLVDISATKLIFETVPSNSN